MIARLATGRIVWAEIADVNGVRKLRPAIVVTPTDRLTPGLAFDVVAISSRVVEPLPEEHVLLPWHAQGHPRTGLKRRCVAVCDWLAQIMDNDVKDMAGVVPTPLMNTILAKTTEAIRKSPSPSADPTTGLNLSGEAQE